MADINNILNRYLDNFRTKLYQRNKVITEENTSALPFKAWQGDRDNINILYSSMKTGHRIIATDDTLSLPVRSMQIDHDGGFNRIVYSGSVYGRVIDKVGNPVYDAGFMTGSGVHEITSGNKFNTASELNVCVGKEREMETESSKHQDLYKMTQARSCFTMYGKKADNTFKSYEQYYERHLATIIEGRNTQASRDTFTYKCFRRISFTSTSKYNVKVDNNSTYDDYDMVTNTTDGSSYKTKLNQYNKEQNSKQYKASDYIKKPDVGIIESAMFSNSNDYNSIDLVADDNIVLQGGKTGLQIYNEGVNIIVKNGTAMIKAKIIRLDGEVFASQNIQVRGSVRRHSGPMPMSAKIAKVGYALDPQVKISKGYDEIPESQKAMTEDQMDSDIDY